VQGSMRASLPKVQGSMRRSLPQMQGSMRQVPQVPSCLCCLRRNMHEVQVQSRVHQGVRRHLPQLPRPVQARMCYLQVRNSPHLIIGSPLNEVLSYRRALGHLLIHFGRARGVQPPRDTLSV
jgi:hypothetical protein